MTASHTAAGKAAGLPWVIAAEFDEQPGLRLTFQQVRRLWALSTPECEAILEYLVASGKLTHDRDGRYARRTIES
jgi:hypothetical protein